ncbi:MAG TPA: UDP-N-acetylmuramoyl-L-alanyl-D-glutamate--2,6-diaminopimelate ligase [Methylophilaceae bacterium]
MTTGAQVLAQMQKTRPRRLVNDSRQVHSGDAFVAYPGEHVDGRDFIQQAIAQGAIAVLWENSGYAWNADWRIANWPVNNLREQIGNIASAFYGEPSQKLWVIGVTGTNGKTSCSHWLAQALQLLGRKTAVIGTLGNGFPNALSTTINTTPDPILLHGLLADYLAQGATDVAMEVSSHALVQHRVNGMSFDVAVLTNLSRDHLDFHGNMTNYIAAKRMLFDWPDLQHAVLNVDDPFGAEMAQQLSKRDIHVLTYGFDQADVQGHDLHFDARGLSMRVTTPQGEAMLSAQLVGRFNANNVLAVLAALLCSGIDFQEAVGAISQLVPIAGRMQQLGGGNQPLVVVDYAHTPDALEKVLSTLKEQCTGRLICVFGCGGDRDKGKRPLMGETVSKLADHAIITADNPRHEKVEDIIADIVQGMRGEYRIEPDRANAIRTAIKQAQAGDIVLLAGKGHEDYQQIGAAKLPFSDLEIAREALS